MTAASLLDPFFPLKNASSTRARSFTRMLESSDISGKPGGSYVYWQPTVQQDSPIAKKALRVNDPEIGQPLNTRVWASCLLSGMKTVSRN